MRKTVVLDVDDVLFDLNGEVERAVRYKYPNFSFRRVYTYDLNKSLSDELKSKLGICDADAWLGLGAPRDYVMSMYSNVDSYKLSKMFTVPRLSELFRKCDVVLHTSGLSVEVCKYKLEQLNTLLDTLGVTGGVSVQLLGSTVPIVVKDEIKYVLDRMCVNKPTLACDYVVEDCLGNLVNYSCGRKLLVDKPWNRPIANPQYKGVLKSSIRVSDINEAIDFILDEVDNE